MATLLSVACRVCEKQGVSVLQCVAVCIKDSDWGGTQWGKSPAVGYYTARNSNVDGRCIAWAVESCVRYISQASGVYLHA